MQLSLDDATATDVSSAVRERRLDATSVIASCFERIEALQPPLGAFRSLRREKALAEAEVLDNRSDIDALPLAGVPIAIKDNVEVEGETTLHGSAAFAPTLEPKDHELVRRLREAGAIVVGKTTLPELGLWPATDGSFGVTRNPWDLERGSGGSSGGSACAVASGMVPVAHGNDGAGSIRIPAAACGTFGIKPGLGLVPQMEHHWFEMTENGPLSTTVNDAALVLSVMAAQPALSKVEVPQRRLNIAISTRPPLRGQRVAKEVKESVRTTAELLEREGHRVVADDPPYNASARTSAIVRWLAGAVEDLGSLDRKALEPRTRRHMTAGLIALRLHLLRDVQAERWRHRAASFFRHYDVLVLPTLADVALDVGPWSERSWMHNVWSSLNFAPFSGLWNLAAFPAASVPAGFSRGLPLGVQLVGPPRSEAAILSVARQLELLRPWPRHAPLSRRSEGD